ncbi:MAG TPA: S8 family serine peptidase [Gammaproteobacteria bacterium]|nr:S8 family serine peptidase [Gammaproteobacteria bacterium]
MRFELKLAMMAAGLALLCPAANAVKAEHAATRPRVVPGEVLVKYRASATRQRVRQSSQRLGVEQRVVRGDRQPTLLVLDKGQRIEAAIEALRNNPAVEYAERIYYRYPRASSRTIPNDPAFPQQWAWDNGGAEAGSIVDADLDMPEAWHILHYAPDIKVAIIDDGFDLKHEDLVDNFAPGGGVSCIKGDCTSGATAALKDADDEFHGTLVAGVLGAEGDNGLGITGALWTVNLLPIRTDLRSDSIASAVRYAVDHNAAIINISLGGAGKTNDEENALDYARQNGVLVVAAAGNHDSNLDYSVLSYPANYDLPNIIAAAASDRQDDMAHFSQWGSFAADVAAPGVDILTTNADGGYSFAGGTSFSTPATAGVAALVAQHLKDETGVIPDYRAIKAHLLAGAEYSGSTGQGDLKGRTAAGRVNAYKSLQPVSGGVLVITDVAIVDSASLAAENDGDGQIDPGETFALEVTLANDWQDESDVRGTLIALNDDLTTAAPNEQDFGAMVASGGDSATASFPVTAGAFTGNHHLLFELDLNTASGKSITRYFYLNVGALDNNATLTQTMQRTNWDEFQAFHVTVPEGGNDLVIYTHTDNDVDIDLLARYAKHPEYDITLGTDPENDAYVFYTDNDPDHPEGHTKVSGNRNGNESIGFAEDTKPGVYHIVAVNFADFKHPYQITACYALPGADQVSFTRTSTEIDEAEDAGVVTLSVTRSGTAGAASVDYATGDDSAVAGTNYASTSGTLNWVDGDNTTKTITIPITDTGTISDASASFKLFHVDLSNATGTALGCVDHGTVTLTGTGDPDTQPPPTPQPPPSPKPPIGSTGGGGGAIGLLFLAALAPLLALRRRHD